LGYARQFGLDCAINEDEAKKMYEMAAKEGHPLAQINLGLLYYYCRNIAVPSGYSCNAMAHYWWNEAAKQGSGMAKNNLRALQVQTPQVSLFEMITNTISNIANVAADIYNKVDKSKVQAYTPPNQRTTTGSPSSGSTPSSTTNDKPCNCDYADITVYQRKYNSDRSRLMDMNTWYDRYNDNDRRRHQADMKRTREEFNSRCCNLSPISKDDWEDWDGKKR
jgi:TPR repeat protein